MTTKESIIKLNMKEHTKPSPSLSQLAIQQL